MSRYHDGCLRLRSQPRCFLVTGVAGFIGSHLLETLLGLEQQVVGLDNFSSGNRENISEALDKVGSKAASRFRFIEGDIREPLVCRDAMAGVQVMLHQAALTSASRSIEDPRTFHAVNVDGFLNLLLAGKAAGVERIVYASSSSVYGDDVAPEQSEERTGQLLSPYAATKRIDEIYAGTFARTHGISSVGLRYFDVFGPRQDAAGPYAAVIPRWIKQLLGNEQCSAFGDGMTSLDFCSVDDVVQANLLAVLTPEADDSVFNVGSGVSTTLLDLFNMIRGEVARHNRSAGSATLRLDSPRAGDVQHSLAAVTRARQVLGYHPADDLVRGISENIAWLAPRVQHSGREAPRRTTPNLRDEFML